MRRERSVMTRAWDDREGSLPCEAVTLTLSLKGGGVEYQIIDRRRFHRGVDAVPATKAVRDAVPRVQGGGVVTCYFTLDDPLSPGPSDSEILMTALDVLRDS